MGSEWTTIGAISEVFDGPHATPTKIEEGPYFLSISSLEAGKLDLEKSAHISEEQFEKWTKRVTPEEGDLLFSYETRLGEAALMPGGVKACLGRRMGLLRIDRTKVDPRYLLFAYLGPEFQQEIRTRTNYGATVERIALKELPDFPIQLPPLPEQKAIAHILGTLDDKIELNRRMNATLEGMAQALFKSWFVDFDPVIDNALAAGNPIPDELAPRADVRKKAIESNRTSLSADSSTVALAKEGASAKAGFPAAFQSTDELGWIPEGWKAKPLSEAIQINPSVKLSKGTVAQFADMKALPTSGYAIDGVIEKKYSGGAKFQNDDVLFARITPCLENGKTGIVDFLSTPEDVGFGSTEFIVLRGKGDLTLPYVACLARDETFRLHCKQSMVGSSGRQRVQNACFDSFHVAIPTEPSALKSFDSITTPMFRKSSEHGKASGTLTKLRDALLPKLISGELRISDAEKCLQPN